ncbi:hypothetical protein BDP27DRAFT_1413672 [Rhodocollybia butyracea]|uniref:Uncharacterized protein n=1 Tax=Rhodocollybia butyracea TaxID=206335 RepID=A0A9P5Q9N4_9AGAR|nr:hypothetical protein BDP27DRAFT_1413672 [Rhodocollybia butyracea]
MEPLHDLYDIENWKYFRPDLDGYLRAARIHGLETKEGLREYTKDLRLDSLPVASLIANDNPPNPGIKIDKDSISIPLLARDFESLGIPRQGILEFPSSRIQVQNPKWEKFIKKDAIRSLHQMKIKNRPSTEADVSFLYDSGRGVLHRISTEQSTSNSRHFATLIVILPSNSPSITLRAQHGSPSATESSTLAENLLFSSHVYTFYTGLDNLDIRSDDHFCYLTYHLYVHDTAPIPMLSGISPVVPGLRDVFRDWRARCSAGDQTPSFVLVMLHGLYSDGLRQADRVLLGHLGPPAKAYGFRMEIVDFEQVESSDHGFPYNYEEYNDFVDLWVLAEELKMEDGDDYQIYANVTGFCDLRGNRIGGYGKNVSKAIEEAIVSGAYISHHGTISDQTPSSDADLASDSLYEMPVILTHRRSLSFLIIRPEGVDMNEGDK